MRRPRRSLLIGDVRAVLQGVFWIAVYLALVATPLLVLLAVDPPPGGGFWWDFAMALGFAALAMMGVQFFLTARFRRATAPYGIDLIYFFHRYLAVIALLLVLAHAAIAIVVNPVFMRAFDPFRAPRHLFAGVLSAGALIALVASSLWRKQIRFGYDAWRVTHVVLAIAAAGLAVVHVHGVDYYVAAPWAFRVWAFIVSTWVAVVLHVRLVKPWRLYTRPYRVASVTAERGSAWTVAVEPVGHGGFTFEPGQFAWLTLRHSPFAMREHPFSISSAPQADGRLEFTIKELGDFTRTIGQIAPGETAYVDGPYGAFSVDRYRAPGCVFIGGGIGMAPLMSMLRALAARGDRRPHLLFVANSRWERSTFREAVAGLAGQLDLRVVHVLEEPPEGWTGETGYVTREMLERHLSGDRADLQYFVCGPQPMIDAIERALYQLGVPLERSHSELFDLV
jgi:predicted ferric reductase